MCAPVGRYGGHLDMGQHKGERRVEGLLEGELRVIGGAHLTDRLGCPIAESTI